MKKKRFIILIIGFILISQFILITFITLTSPYPTSHFLKYAFTLDPYEVLDTPNQSHIKTQSYMYDEVKMVHLDMIYDDRFDDYDKTIVWIHGGGFVGGKSDDINPYLFYLAQEGHIIISLNYTLSPFEIFPFQIRQIGLAMSYISDLNDDRIDMNKLVFGGDSAGAHMALNFVTVQVNPSYQILTEISPVLEKAQIDSLILFCGPYDFFDFANKKGLLNQFIIHKIGWAYSGNYGWYNDSNLLYQASLYMHINEDFPKVYLTDGNEAGPFDFKSGALLLSEALKARKVETYGILDYSQDDYTFNHIKTYEEAFNLSHDETLVLSHNYQFRLERYYDIESFTRTDDPSTGFSPAKIVLDDLIKFLGV